MTSPGWVWETPEAQRRYVAHTVIFRSHDGGFTWGDPTVVAPGVTEVGACFNEVAVVPMRDGPWVALIRCNYVAPSRFGSLLTYRSVSTDRGRTWTAPEQALGANVVWILSTNTVLAGALLL